MSWKDALEDIVTDMKEEIEDLKGVEDAGSAYTRNALRGYMGRLKSVLKAAGDAPVVQPTFTPNPMITPEMQRIIEVNKHRAEFSAKKIEKEEEHDGNMVEVLEIPGEDPFYHAIDPKMQVGNRMAVSGHVCQLKRRDGKLVLVYDEVQTQQLKEQQKGKSEGGVILGS